MKLNELIDALIEVRDKRGNAECFISIDSKYENFCTYIDDLGFINGEVILYGETNEL